MRYRRYSHVRGCPAFPGALSRMPIMLAQKFSQAGLHGAGDGEFDGERRGHVGADGVAFPSSVRLDLILVDPRPLW